MLTFELGHRRLPDHRLDSLVLSAPHYKKTRDIIFFCSFARQKLSQGASQTGRHQAGVFRSTQSTSHSFGSHHLVVSFWTVNRSMDVSYCRKCYSCMHIPSSLQKQRFKNPKNSPAASSRFYEAIRYRVVICRGHQCSSPGGRKVDGETALTLPSTSTL